MGDTYRDLRQHCSLAAFPAADPSRQVIPADHRALEIIITATVLGPSSHSAH